MPARRRKWPWILLSLVLLLCVAAWAFFAFALAPIILAKLQDTVAERLFATMKIGALRYEFPFAVRATDVHLYSTADQDAEIFSADQIHFKLLELPRKAKPLMIRDITLDHPTLHIIRRTDGSFVGTHLLRPTTHHEPSSSTQPSDLFRLRYLNLVSGKIEFVDHKTNRPLPVQWEDLNLHLNLAPKSEAIYGWEFTSQNNAITHLSAGGSIDIDQAVLQLDHFIFEAHPAAGADLRSLPPKAQRAVQTFNLEGDIRCELQGNLPLLNPDAARLNGSVKLSNLRAKVGTFPLAVDFEIDLAKQAAQAQINLALNLLRVHTFAGNIDATRADVVFDMNTLHWQAMNLAAALTPPQSDQTGGALRIGGMIAGTASQIDQYGFIGEFDDLSVAVPTFNTYLSHVTGKFHTQDHALLAEHLSAQYGDDQYVVLAARIPLDEPRDRIDVRDFALAMTFHSPSPQYPNPLRKTISSLNPNGPFDLRGRYIYMLQGPDDFDMTLTSQGGAIAVTNDKIPITNLTLQILLQNNAASVQNFQGNLFNGRIGGSGSLTLNDVKDFSSQVTLRNIDLNELSKTSLMSSERKNSLSGLLNSDLTLSGRGGDTSALQGNGEAQISQGRFWEVPLISGIAARTRITHEALTAGDAAAVFEIANRTVTLRSAAINSTALGLQGKGTVGFDNTLNLNVIGAPLGDWEKNLKRTGIPLFSAVAGDVVGGFQKLVNSATSQLLYQFKVTGNASAPQIEAVPAPLLTQNAGKVFGTMLRHERSLMEAVEERSKSDAQ